MRKRGFLAKKHLGQNFLVDKVYLEKVVNAGDLTKDDVVLEIGAGVGNLTIALAWRAGHVIAVEIDGVLMEALERSLKGCSNVTLVHGDIMQLNLTNLMSFDIKKEGRRKVVANLPYYITTPVILKLIETKPLFERIVVMVQKEVALRMVAAPGRKDYGAFSVAVQFWCEPEIIANVPASAFRPSPEVESSIVRLLVRREPRVFVVDEEVFFSIVRASFQQRRKMLRNSLGALGIPRSDEGLILESLLDAGISPDRRGETLSLEEFARLANSIAGKGEKGYDVHKSDKGSSEFQGDL